jgi:hypothetical protein
MKQFDEEFSRKAKEAFESYNADHLADEGWNSFNRKYGRKRSRAIIIHLWARAASILILVTAGVLFINRMDHRQTGEPASQIAKENPGGLTESSEKVQDTAGEKPAVASSVQVTESTAGQTGNAVMKNTDLLTGATAISVLTEPVMPADTAPDFQLPDNPIEIRLTGNADMKLKLQARETVQYYQDIPKEKMTTTVMTGFSGMMASIDNAKSQATGVSIGFWVERQLTRRISIRPGLAMARHSYGMEGTPGGSAAFNYDAPELNGMSGSTTSYKADIEVLSMEVPVNFVFSILKRGGSNLFVTTGASTVFYLSQHLSGNFNNTYTRTTVDSYTGQVSYESMTTSVKVESEQELLNRVDFLGLANFSAGYSLPFGKTTHISFEPFVQLPIKDLTSLNLRIRYGGLSLKLQF